MHQPSTTEFHMTSASQSNTNVQTTGVKAQALSAKQPKRARLFRTRWILRAIAFVLASLPFWLTIGHDAAYYRNTGYWHPSFWLWFIGLPMVWDIAEFIVLCVNRKGAHLTVHVGLDLVAGLMLVGVGSYLAATMYFEPSNLDIATCLFVFAAGAIHFVIMILACIAFVSQRKARRRNDPEHFLAMYDAPLVTMLPHDTKVTQGTICYLPDGQPIHVAPYGMQQHLQQRSRQSSKLSHSSEQTSSASKSEA